ncbi:hypothetical protein PIB30_001593 [Stylosanthes scabra]|uniref:Uncharacterized protein n=1 Tax=Stylosanthes scabra TaxID=79078 RepID=A0ABU6S275_9FABA|nr:hypothetical protein [Stylosanthes scabra]
MSSGRSANLMCDIDGEEKLLTVDLAIEFKDLMLRINSEVSPQSVASFYYEVDNKSRVKEENQREWQACLGYFSPLGPRQVIPVFLGKPEGAIDDSAIRVDVENLKNKGWRTSFFCQRPKLIGFLKRLIDEFQQLIP